MRSRRLRMKHIFRSGMTDAVSSLNLMIDACNAKDEDMTSQQELVKKLNCHDDIHLHCRFIHCIVMNLSTVKAIS